MRRDDFQHPRTRDRIGRDIDDEVRAHLEERTAELMARGLARDEAAAAALREFGDVDAARADLRRVDEQAARRSLLTEVFHDLGSDLRRAFRSLMRRPGFTAVAVGTLALGIGANAVMFGLIDRLLLSGPPHVVDPEHLAPLEISQTTATGQITSARGPYVFSQMLAVRQDLFVGVAAYSDRALTLSVGERALELAVGAVTPNYFSVLGLRPAVGRFLNGSTDGSDDRAVVVSHSLWRRQLGGAENVIGRQVRLGGEQFTIVGIAPRGYNGDGMTPLDAWILLGPGTPTLGARWSSADVFMLARLRADVPTAAMREEAGRLYRSWLTSEQRPDTSASIRFGTMMEGRRGDSGFTPAARVALWLQAVSVLVLLIAAANVVNLLLLRAIERQRETAVHLALGISRVRLVRHLSLESLLIAMTGGVLAVMLTRWVGPELWAVVVPRTIDAGPVIGRLTASTVAIAVCCAVVMTVVPALIQRASTSTDVLRSGSRGATRQGSRLGASLVVLQVTLTVVLLVGAGLFVRSMQRLTALDLGIDAEQVIGVRVSSVASATRADRDAMATRVEEALRRMPGVSSVAVGLSAPFRPSLNLRFRLPGKDSLPGVGQNALGFPTFFAVTPDYFATMGIHILRGRGFAIGDRAGSPRVMLIDATMARAFWPNEDAIGRCVQIGADTMPCTTVVGVVEDTRRFLAQPNHSLRYYLPIEQSPYRTPEPYFFLRTSRATQPLVDAVRATAAAAAPTAPFVEAFPMESLLDPQMQQWRLGTTAFVSFSALATLIATIGLFGIISFSVARRERELGIRRALGESWQRVIRRVVLEATWRSALGVLFGGALSFVLGRQLRAILFRPSAADAVVFVAAAVIVFAATLVASAAPAVRAARVDPMQALRAE